MHCRLGYLHAVRATGPSSRLRTLAAPSQAPTRIQLKIDIDQYEITGSRHQLLAMKPRYKPVAASIPAHRLGPHAGS